MVSHMNNVILIRRAVRRGGVALGFILAGAAAGMAQEAGPVSIEVSDCITLATPAERLACFESRVDEARAAPAVEASDGSGDAAEASRAPAAADAAEVAATAEAAAPAAEAAPGAEAASAGEAAPVAQAAPVAERAPVAEAESAAEPASLDDFGLRQSRDGGFERDEMTATIASVREVAPNRHLITLENGQVWRQMQPERYRLRPGQHARIYSTRWGASYRLTVEELRGFIQVQRVQ